MFEKAPPILLVEDDEDDAFLILKAFRSLASPLTIRHCREAQEAIDHLQSQVLVLGDGEYSLPPLVVLDLKMPGRSGFDVLQWIRSHDQSAPVVVVVLTSSTSQQDVEKADQLNVNAYWIKPVGLQDMKEVARCICHLWLDHIPRPLQKRLFESTS